MRILGAITVCGLVLASAPSAHAGEAFRVNVPLDVKNLDPTVTGVRVECTLTGKGKVGKAKERLLPVTAGALTYPLSEPLAFVWYAEDFTPTDLATITGGQCRFFLYAGSEKTPGGSDPATQPKAGTPFRPVVTFTFP